MATISDDLAASLTKALNLAQLDMMNQDKLFNSSGDVTITRPDGSTFTGASWRKMMTATTGRAAAGKNSDITELTGLTIALSIAQGGTGAKTAADARKKLELGDAATKNTGKGASDVMQPGMFGLGLAEGAITTNSPNFSSLINDSFVSKGIGLCAFRNDTQVTGGDTPFYQYSPSLFFRTRDTWAVFNCDYNGGPIRVFAGSISDKNLITSTNGRTLWDTKNTTVDSNGIIRRASPVARIVKSRDENERKDLDESGFSWCGCGTANDEAEGINISRLDVGVYLLTGSNGLATSGWQLLPPMDPLGSGELGLVEAEQTESGGITVYLFRRKYMLSDDGEIVKAKGEPIDVPANSWIDVRLDMPANTANDLKAQLDSRQ